MNRLSQIILSKNIIEKETKKRLRVPLDLIFPASNHVYFSEIKNKLFWIPDFQEHFLPQFFSESEIKSRKIHQQRLSTDRSNIVFSSNDALNHYRSIYPASQAKTFVLPFAVTHPAYQSIDKAQLFSKFLIDRPYFFCPNQVWVHKNHITVLKAVKKLKEEGQKNILIVFSGKQYDSRNPEVFNNLSNYISEHQLEENVKFLGFIDRKDQLQLMNYAAAVLQPSLFEGWSTSVEDAKAMNQFLILSDLSVHREQVGTNAVFFDPLSETGLAAHLKSTVEVPPVRAGNNTYQNNIADFGNQFMKIANAIAVS
jgi:glycosyltransferase involved in cell wall biosynthesis